ncbi:hypothetical protein [Halomonas denitrificans]|nr:hypothetical protein [Halomonas denitrificans]
MLAELRVTSLSLDYTAFDQTPGSGFRVLAGAGCPAQAADLIEFYIERTGAEQRSLVWHLAQMRGEAGQVEAAIAAARSTLDENEARDDGFRWNAHVRAYLGVLEQDREAFEVAVGELRDAVDDHPGNAMNFGLWDRLAPHFDLGYRGALVAAYGVAETDSD